MAKSKPRRLPHRPATVSSDEQRYHLYRRGVSAEEQATRENVRLATVQASIDRQLALADRYSLESVNQEARAELSSLIPTAFAMLEEAMRPQVQQFDSEGAPIPQPDYATCMRAYKEFKETLLGMQPKSPLVNVDARSQTQVNNQMLPSGQVLSTESIIRQIRSERGLALPSDTSQAIPTVFRSSEKEFVEVDYELQQELSEGTDSGESQG